MLGSGGARGLAHIGVIEVLQVYPPDALIEIPVDSCSIFEFYKTESQFELERERYQKALHISRKNCLKGESSALRLLT